jgi:GNAT superfamily N-acetyltransferase
MHARAEGIREADHVTGRAAAEGAERVAAVQRADEFTAGPTTIAPRAARTPVTDLSHMTPLGDLYDRRSRGDLDDSDLTRELRGLQRRYGPYQVEDLIAWHTPAWVDKDGHTVPALVRFVADIRDSKGNEAGSLIYSFTRDDRGELVVTNERTELHKDFTGKGFATTFSASTEDYFRRSGVDRMELIATRLNDVTPLVRSGVCESLNAQDLGGKARRRSWQPVNDIPLSRWFGS